MKYRSILLFGAPGVGKGTQGKILGSIPHFFHSSSGDIFRSLRADSPLGKLFIEYSSRGELVPDEQTIELWWQFIQASRQGGRFRPEQDTLVLDGIPRNVKQAEILSDTIDVVSVIYLKAINEKKLISRIQHRAVKENRLDDANIRTVRNRLRTYERDTKPVLKYYGRHLVHRVNADQSPAKVLSDILRHVVKE